MPTAREVVQALDDEQRWLAEHRQPALVFDAPGLVVEGVRVDTPDQPYFTRDAGSTMVPFDDDDDEASATQALAAVQACVASVALDGLRADTRIEFLAKSARNPFGALITVGRTANNDIVLPHSTVSKVHAIFSDLGGGWLVSDSGSSNGTYVDGVRLPARERRPIDDGAEVRFGRDLRARFVLPHSLLAMLRDAHRASRRSWT